MSWINHECETKAVTEFFTYRAFQSRDFVSDFGSHHVANIPREVKPHTLKERYPHGWADTTTTTTSFPTVAGGVRGVYFVLDSFSGEETQKNR